MPRIIDNYDYYKEPEEDPRYEAKQELLSDIISDIDEVITGLDDYDTEDNKDLCNRIEKAMEDLRNLIGKLEDAR